MSFLCCWMSFSCLSLMHNKSHWVMALFQGKDLINSLPNSQWEMHRDISKWVVCNLGIKKTLMVPELRPTEILASFSGKLFSHVHRLEFESKTSIKKEGRLLKENETATTGQIILNRKWEHSHWQRHKGNIFPRMNSPRKIYSPVSDTTRPFLPYETWMSPFSTSSFQLSKQNFSSRKNNEFSPFTSSISSLMY